MGRSSSPRRAALTPPLSGGLRGPGRSRSGSRASARGGSDEAGKRVPVGGSSPGKGGAAAPGGRGNSAVRAAARKATRAAKRKRAAQNRAARAAGTVEKGAPAGASPVPGGAAAPEGQKPKAEAKATPRAGGARKVGRDKSASPRVRRRVGVGGTEDLQMDKTATIAGLSPLRWPGTDHREQLKAEKKGQRSHAPSPPPNNPRRDGGRPSPERRSSSLVRKPSKGKGDKGKGRGGKSGKGRKRSRSKGGGKGRERPQRLRTDERNQGG